MDDGSGFTGISFAVFPIQNFKKLYKIKARYEYCATSQKRVAVNRIVVINLEYIYIYIVYFRIQIVISLCTGSETHSSEFLPITKNIGSTLAFEGEINTHQRRW